MVNVHRWPAEHLLDMRTPGGWGGPSYRRANAESSGSAVQWPRGDVCVPVCNNKNRGSVMKTFVGLPARELHFHLRFLH